jgi:thiamine kinase-like enzyme
MTEIHIPIKVEEITPAWLTRVLARNGLNGGVAVNSIATERIGEGVGFIGELQRITLEYATEPPPDCPQTLIAKFPTSNEAYRSIALLLNLYGREHQFYRQIAEHTGISTPVVYHNDADPDRHAYILLLEDLSHTRVGDQLASCSLDDARLALQEAARLHSAWWESPRLQEFNWIPDIADVEYIALLKGVYQLGWPAFLAKQGNELPIFPDEFIDIGHRFGQHFDTAMANMNDLPKTLAHYDYRLDNMLFDDSQEHTRLVVIDWQMIHRSTGVFDVAYFLGGNFPVEVRRDREHELVRYYHDHLIGNGVSDYSFDQCWEDYRLSTLALLLFMVSSQNEIELSDLNDRARTLVTSMFERYATTILDAGAGDFLPPAV